MTPQVQCLVVSRGSNTLPIGEAPDWAPPPQSSPSPLRGGIKGGGSGPCSTSMWLRPESAAPSHPPTALIPPPPRGRSGGGSLHTHKSIHLLPLHPPHTILRPTNLTPSGSREPASVVVRWGGDVVIPAGKRKCYRVYGGPEPESRAPENPIACGEALSHTLKLTEAGPRHVHADKKPRRGRRFGAAD